MNEEFLICHDRGKIELPAVGDRAHLILVDGYHYIVLLEIDEISDENYIGTVLGVFDQNSEGQVLGGKVKDDYEGKKIETTHEYIHKTIKRNP